MGGAIAFHRLWTDRFTEEWRLRRESPQHRPVLDHDHIDVVESNLSEVSRFAGRRSTETSSHDTSDMSDHECSHRLSDEQMRSYLTDGFLVLQSGLPKQVHDHIRNRCEEIFATTGNPGNEILEMNPALRLVFAEPGIKGALNSILGDGYFMHPHRHCHQNRSGTPAQRNHKDSYEEDINVHHHRSRWAMAMYYPQDVTADMGPTGVTPGSQYFSSEKSLVGHGELGVVGEAGTVILVHYDVWHRALRNHSGRNRYMLKFLFCRATEPTAPAWNNQEEEWQAPAGREQALLEPLWQAMWRWNRGASIPAEGWECGSVVLADLLVGSEMERLRTAYTIGPKDFDQYDEVFRLWRAEADEAEVQARSQDHTSPCEHMFGYALANQGAAGLPLLEEAMGSEDWRIRGSAVDAVGDMGNEARCLVQRVAVMTGDPSPWVRRNAVEALGMLGDADDDVTTILGQALSDEDYLVGHNAALSLRKLGTASDATIDMLLEAATHPELYRRKNALMALEVLLE